MANRRYYSSVTIAQDAQFLAQAIEAAGHLVVMTGAGASADSGIPTFRDALTGHWASHDPQDLATPQAYARDPALVTRWYDERRLQVLACQPNPGHLALAAIERWRKDRGLATVVVTQNVDRLHQRAGSQRVIELHGSIVQWRAAAGGHEQVCELPQAFEHYPPQCPGGPMRPDVVWFGEALPELALERAYAALESADLYVCVGTSGLVYPAAGMLEIAAAAGARCVTVNPEPTPQDGLCDRVLRQRSGPLLAKVAGLLGALG